MASDTPPFVSELSPEHWDGRRGLDPSKHGTGPPLENKALCWQDVITSTDFSVDIPARNMLETEQTVRAISPILKMTARLHLGSFVALKPLI